MKTHNNEAAYVVKPLKKMDQYGSCTYSLEIEGRYFEFTGNYYERLVNPTDWQYGVCPVCGNVSGRTSVGARDYCFCLDHREGWFSGIDCFCEHKEPWYTEEIAHKNREFLKTLLGNAG